MIDEREESEEKSSEKKVACLATPAFSRSATSKSSTNAAAAAAHFHIVHHCSAVHSTNNFILPIYPHCYYYITFPDHHRSLVARRSSLATGPVLYY